MAEVRYIKTGPIHIAEYFKNYFDFFDWPTRKNISAHFQYLEFLYHIKKEKKPILTILSLLNKNIIIEMFIIVECVIYNLLTKLRVDVNFDESINLSVGEYTPMAHLIDQAVYYKILSKEMGGIVKRFSKVRNSIHIKSPVDGKPEYNAYSNSILNDCEGHFREILTYIWRKELVDYSTFDWPGQ